ncbi:hypothetical protein [Solidesulfovibrio sp.]|uniref:hypothetical protein n=1 Tax=Solidesulfovibrio sp. TaxID=2910990 RepID=UPI002619F596|nr:hypothetical protein [Solidesulfovibrio sp.]
MTPSWTLTLAGAGFALLAASLFVKKKAGWAAVAGMALLGTLAVLESDPLLALGALALAASGRCKPARQDSPDRDATAHGNGPHPPRGQRP